MAVYNNRGDAASGSITINTDGTTEHWSDQMSSLAIDTGPYQKNDFIFNWNGQQITLQEIVDKLQDLEQQSVKQQSQSNPGYPIFKEGMIVSKTWEDSDFARVISGNDEYGGGFYPEVE